ncbi:MAG: serine/threonine-protein kinase [Planctomycetaceae bacterium]
MSHSATHCNDASLRALLAADEASDDFVDLSSHVQSCDRCQRRLEELAGTPVDWEEARDVLASFTDDELNLRATRFEPYARPNFDTAWTDAMAGQVLGAPSHPEMLGRIGRYEVERLLGSGGMGIVFKAFDSELNRPVAIKVLAPFLASSGAARQRFSREARAAAAVVHEHVVPIHNVEADVEFPYLVMRYVSGESLQQRLDRVGPLELGDILRIALQTAAGLEAAHAQGLVHRDVKPSNILLEDRTERALLTDFGLARAGDDASLTRTGFHPGTPQYMSPEQARGDRVDARSDLFSLGSVMYEMATGRLPFRAETTYGILRRITDNVPRPIREINPLIPRWLVAIVERLHSKPVEGRYQSAEEVRELLENCLAHVRQPDAVPLPRSLPRDAAAATLWNRAGGRNGMLAGGAAIAVGLAALLFAPRSSDERPDVVEPASSGASQVADTAGGAAQSDAEAASYGEPTTDVQSSSAPPTSSAIDASWDGTNAELSEVSAAIEALESRHDSLWESSFLPSPVTPEVE